MAKKTLTVKELTSRGGKARWNGVSKTARRELAKKAAAARWGKRES